LLDVDTDAFSKVLLRESLFLAQFYNADWEAGSERVLRHEYSVSVQYHLLTSKDSIWYYKGIISVS
jgi:hypothetical protein